MTDLDDRISEYAKWIESRYDDSHELRAKGKNGYIDGKADAYESSPSQRRTSTSLRGRLMMISQYDKDMCCLYIAEGMSYIWQQRWNQELSRILESLADRKLMKRVHGGYAITLKGLLAVKVWRLHLFLFHHDEYKYFRRKK